MDSSKKQHTSIQEQPDTAQEVVITNSSPSLERGQLFFILSTYQSRLAALRSRINHDIVVRYFLLPAAALLVVGGFMYWKFYVNGMDIKYVTVGGYNYSFTFPRPAKYEQYSNGMRGFAVNEDKVAEVGPVSGLSELCGLNGDPYTVAFLAQVDGAIRPVCTAQNSQDQQLYMVTFTAQNSYHELMITYGYSQNVKDYPKLRSIIESIRASK